MFIHDKYVFETMFLKRLIFNCLQNINKTQKEQSSENHQFSDNDYL